MSSKHNSFFRATSHQDANPKEDSAQSHPSNVRHRPLGRLTVPELERRISLLERQATRYPELAEACLLERDRLGRVLADKRSAKVSE
jgi:hypothetical protein